MAKRKRARKRDDGRETRICFVIMPYGKKDDTTSRRKRKPKLDFDAVYNAIIKPAVQGVGRRGMRIRCIRSDKIAQPGLIHERMIRWIGEADVAIADITTLNPNVFYELGVRHALRSRVTVMIRRKGQPPNPFNVAGMSTIEYDPRTNESAARARTSITNYIYNGLESSATDSLVQAMLPGLNPALPPKEIGTTDVMEYRIPGAKDRCIGIVTGNLRYVNLSAVLSKHPITIWVSSENVNMQMARPYEESISAMIRYLGARKDETGTIVVDTIRNELRKRMGRRQVVNPGEVVSTGAGCLADTHGVKRIFHAASVYGVVGTGFHPIAHVEKCITNALARADREYREKDTPTGTSLLFPLLGTGTARADVIASAKRQMGAVVAYFRSRADSTRVERVYFLAPFKSHLEGMTVALAEMGITKPWRGRRAKTEPTPRRTTDDARPRRGRGGARTAAH